MGLRILFRISSARQGEIKGSSFVHFGFSPDAAAVALDDALNDGEADAGAFKLLDGVQPLKNTKEIFSRSRMSKPAPLSRTKYTFSPFC